MMRAIATFIDGELYSVQGARISEPRVEARKIVTSHAIVPKAEGLDRIVAMLADVVAVAKELSPADQQRARGFVATTQAVMSATGYLEPDDQAAFQSALRNAIARGDR